MIGRASAQAHPARGLGTALACSIALAFAAVLSLAAAFTDDAAAPQPPSAGISASQPSADEARREVMMSGLRGSKHDFTLNGTLGRDLCLPCHTPHLVSPPAPALDKRSEALTPMRPYRGPDIELTSWSLVCLGCHDGVTAPDVYTSSHAVQIVGQLANSRLGATSLKSHPVGTKYPAFGGDYASRDAVEAAGLPLPDGRIQCTTCHDAHNTHRHPGMLRVSDDRSRMCLTCHRL